MSQPAASLLPEPAEPRLRRTVTWRSAVLIALGTALLVNVSLGPMAASIGNASLLVWLGTAVIGGVQCLLLAELAAHLPDRAGGTATYAHAALGRNAPLLGALSSWGYWFAWTPGIAVNLILAAQYLRATVLPWAPTIPLVLLTAALLYTVNSLGLLLSMRLSAVVAAAAVLPLLAMVVGLALHPELLDAARLEPLAVPGEPWSAATTWALIAKWTFVAAWSAYGAEMASTIIAEMRDPQRRALRTMVVSGTVGVVAFAGTPVVLVALVGQQGLTADPSVVFLPAAKLVFGGAGSTVIGLMLAAGLILGAQAFVVGSSRTIYQMTADGHMPRQFAAVNRHGVPIGSLLWDALIVLALLLIFGTNVVNIVAAANFGYLVVFVLMPIAYLVLRGRLRSAQGTPFVLPPVFKVVAIALALFNAVLLVVGGVQWGLSAGLVGVIVLAFAIPLSLLSQWQRRRASSR